MASRTRNATRNIVSGILNRFVHLVFPFVIRSIVIQVFGAEYLGLGSLFTSVLQVLNLAEMGVSNAIIYNMYYPIAKKDTKTICALVNLYKRVYRIIGLIVLSVGIALMPFLQYFIHGDIPEGINIYVLYVFYLLSTVSTYFLFAYKSALVNAHQRNDIVSNMYTVSSLIQYALQIIALLVFKNFYFYIVAQCLTNVLNNIFVAIVAKRRYPDYSCKGNVTSEQKKDIRKRVTGLMIQRICSTTRNSLDSIFISSMIGLTAVAIYSNYYTIMMMIVGFMAIIASSITAGVGNSIVTESEEKNYSDMNKFNFLYMWFSGWLTICLACLYQPLMHVWMGNENMFSYGIVIMFCIYFYSLKMGDVRAIYSDAKGLWYENRYRAIVESIANVVLNAVLGYFFGVAGIIAGTLVSLLIINFGYGSQILFKYYFKSYKVSGYFIRHGLYALVTLIVCVITFFVCSFVTIGGVSELIIKGGICVILPNLLYYLFYRKTDMFKKSKAFVAGLVPKRFRGRRQ